MKISRTILYKIGVFPIRDHYYEPMFNPKHLRKPLDEDRNLTGIDLNTNGQIKLLKSFNYSDELREIPQKKVDDGFYYENGSFQYGDAEYFYNMIRFFKPKKIIEVGCGNSTLLTLKALNGNSKQDPNYYCEHICIEPYEMPWLETLPIKLVRNKVETEDKKIFESLEENDILFIDSSHVIRPQGDVLYLFLEILPILKKGVLIHFHDIFTPKDYRYTEIYNNVRLWNEQYLFEAFMTMNLNFKIVGGLNYLINNHFELLLEKCPNIIKMSTRELASIWIQKVK